MMGPANAPPLSSQVRELAAIDDVVSRTAALYTLYWGQDFDYDSDEDEDEVKFNMIGEIYSPPDPLSCAHDRLESIEDLYSSVPYDPYAAIVLAKPDDLDIGLLRERVASLESHTSEFVPRLLALERCFKKVPTPPEIKPEGTDPPRTDLTGRLTIVEYKVFGHDQPGGLVERLIALELKAVDFDQSGQPPQIQIEAPEAFESPLIGEPDMEVEGQPEKVMGTMVNGSPSCDGSPPPQAADAANKICCSNDQTISMHFSIRSPPAVFSTPDPSPSPSAVMPSTALVTSKELVREPFPGGVMVTGIEPGSVVGEPPGNELGSVVGEPPGDGHGGTPLAIGIGLGPEVGEPPGGGKEGTFFFPDIGHGTATSAGSGWRSDSGA
jgi:hypothetical protein